MRHSWQKCSKNFDKMQWQMDLVSFKITSAIFITICLNSVESYVLNLNLKSVFNKEKDKIFFQTDHNKNCHFATGWRPAIKEENHLHQVRV